MGDAIILTDKLSKTFISKERKRFLRPEKKKVVALDDVSLEVKEGEFFGLLGPNGAGKTTLIRCLTTLLIPSTGRAWVNGYEVGRQDDEVRASIGCMLMGERGLYWKLTGTENLEYFAALYHIPRAERDRRISELKSRLDMGEFLDRTVETYSSGQKMLMAFAKALLNDAPILFLDEPTVTMDVHNARKLRAMVRELNEKEKKTIVYTTHLMHEADELCNRIAIIDKGRIIALGTPQELKRAHRAEETLEIEGIIPEPALAALRRVEGVKEAALTAETDGSAKVSIILGSDRSKVLPRLIETLVSMKAEVRHVRAQDVTLEDVFVAKTGRSLSVDTKANGAVGGKNGDPVAK
ncbi:MAG TPA: ABC transporter ATP-binding protein [Thermoplasmata archaeon]|nr:ABC transporter ATP-binding protein [Thermoplasmata archaeon]